MSQKKKLSPFYSSGITMEAQAIIIIAWASNPFWVQLNAFFFFFMAYTISSFQYSCRRHELIAGVVRSNFM